MPQNGDYNIQAWSPILKRLVKEAFVKMHWNGLPISHSKIGTLFVSQEYLDRCINMCG